MRTTVTLDSDTYALVQQRMRQRGVSFKVALNDAIRAGLAAPGAGRAAARYRTPVAKMGVPSVALDRALQLAGNLEDEETVRKARLGK